MALILGLAAAALFVVGFRGYRLLASTGLEEVEEQYRPDEVSSRPKGFTGLLDTLGDRVLGWAVRAYGPDRLKRLDTTIRRAGRPDGVTVTVYVRRQAGFVFVGTILFVVLLLAGQLLIGALCLVLLSGWMPLWLAGAVRTRQRELDRELPDFLDVLGVTVSAGLGFRAALERVCEFHDGALAQEMQRTLREMAVGVPRREAFVALRERSRSEALSTFVTALLQAEELGVPLADALADIAREVRREHAMAVRQEAAKAAPKVSLVVTLTILPAAMMLVIASVLISNAGAFSGIL